MPLPLTLVLFAVAAVYAYLWVGLLVWTAVPSIALGLDPVVVTTGSMAPTIRPGDVVLLADAQSLDLVPGAVVTFRDHSRDGRLVTHRLVHPTDDGRWITRGDANAQPDPEPVAPADIVGTGRLLVPYLGLPIVWLRDGAVPLAVVWAVITGATLVMTPPAAAPTARTRRRLPVMLRLGLWLRRRARLVPTGSLAIAVAVLVGAQGTSVAAFVATATNPANGFAAASATLPLRYHLHNDPADAAEPTAPTGPTPARLTMLAHPTAPTGSDLHPYSDDLRPGRAGRWLQPTDDPSGAGPAHAATWTTTPAPTSVQLDGPATFTVWVMRRGGGPPHTSRQLTATLSGSTWSASSVVPLDLPSNNTWTPISAQVDLAGQVVAVGERLTFRLHDVTEELAVAYGTTTYPASLQLPAGPPS